MENPNQDEAWIESLPQHTRFLLKNPDLKEYHEIWKKDLKEKITAKRIKNFELAEMVLKRYEFIYGIKGLALLGINQLCFMSDSPFIVLPGIIPAIGAALAFADMSGSILQKSVLAYKINKALKEPGKYPVEDAERVIIQDEKGLEAILGRAALKEKTEWGTFLNAEYADGNTLVTRIESSYIAEEEKLVKSRKKSSIRLNISKAKKLGYNGALHYHPPSEKFDDLESANYAVSAADKVVSPLNWIGFITFNSISGTEIIGYTHINTYIPEKRDKSVLVKAGRDEIMEYLGKF